LQEFKAYKTLEAHKQVVDRWVQEIYTQKPANSNITFIAAKMRIKDHVNVI
jgi:hypothetical protein